MKIGLALGAGFSKGLAHIGVLKALEKENIKINYLSGTSMGAVVAALYAAGYTPKQLEELAYNTDWNKLADFVLPTKGIVKGDKIKDKLNSLLKNKSFAQLKKPLIIPSVNLTKGELHLFDRGDVATAVRASLSFPGVFAPFRIHKDIYIDGGILDPLPVDAVKKLGADKVIAVKLTSIQKPEKGKQEKPSDIIQELKETFVDVELDSFKHYVKDHNIHLPFLFRLLLRPKSIKRWLGGAEHNIKMPDILKITVDSIYVMARELNKYESKKYHPDIIITPTLYNVGWFDFDKIDYFIKQGEIATKKQIKFIKKLR